MSRELRKPQRRIDHDRSSELTPPPMAEGLSEAANSAGVSVGLAGHALGRMGIQPAELDESDQLREESQDGGLTAPHLGAAGARRRASRHERSADLPRASNSPIVVQPQLAVNEPGDLFEQEADAAADALTEAADSGQASATEGRDSVPRATRRPQTTSAPPVTPMAAQRMTESTSTVSAATPSTDVAPSVADRVAALHGNGQALDPETKAVMEPHFGHDFSRVRVHTDTGAVSTARSLDAAAFTLGSDIAFGAGQFQPQTPTGRRLLAHELTHVVQQEGPALGSSTSSDAAAEGVLTVQRDPVSTATPDAPAPAAAPAAAEPAAAAATTWNAPEDFGSMVDRGGARVALGEMLKSIDVFKDVDVGEVPAQRALTRKKVEEQQGKLQGAGTLTAAEIAELNPLSTLYTAFITSARTALSNAVRAGLKGLFNPPGMGDVMAAIDEAKHALFKAPDDAKLEKLKDATEKVKDLTENVKWVADNSLKIMSEIESARKVFEISEKLEKFGGVLEKLLTVKRVGDDLLKLSKEAGGGNSSLGGADAIEAGVDLAGLIGKSAMKAVPLFGDYWEKYLVPMTKKCCAILRRAEDIADLAAGNEIRRLVDPQHPSPTPPELSPKTYAAMEGGRDVFEYIYLTRYGKQPAMGAHVEKVLMEKRKVLEKVSGDDVELEEAHWYNPLTWVNRKAKDLPAWVAKNVGEVWASFYGSQGV